MAGFLPWHRHYLLNFEQAMQRFEPAFFVRYWRWMDQSNIPSWLAGFKPAGVSDANGKPIKVTRNPGQVAGSGFSELPSSQTIQTTVMNAANYTVFTLALAMRAALWRA